MEAKRKGRSETASAGTSANSAATSSAEAGSKTEIGSSGTMKKGPQDTGVVALFHVQMARAFSRAMRRPENDVLDTAKLKRS